MLHCTSLFLDRLTPGCDAHLSLVLIQAAACPAVSLIASNVAKLVLSQKRAWTVLQEMISVGLVHTSRRWHHMCLSVLQW